MGEHIIYNNNFYRQEEPIIQASNRGFRYGDGFFETMRCKNQHILLANHHFERLFYTLNVLQFKIPKHFTPHFFQEQIQKLLKKNNHQHHARVRLTIFRSNGGLYDAENHLPNYIIETWQLDNYYEFNTNGLVIDVFTEARKTCDNYANLKTNNFLPYTMAAIWAKQNLLNDAMLLNAENYIADTTIANVFIVKDDIIKTPSLTQGCITGVMRKHIIESLKRVDYKIDESAITLNDVLCANEVFLTNAIRGIQWVKQFKETKFVNNISYKIFQQLYKQII